jgi:methyltransferase
VSYVDVSSRTEVMVETPRRLQRLSVALPSSFTKDVPHLREKTSRIGLVARALAIFRVEEIMIYNADTSAASVKEGKLFEKLLGYQETPQYIRRTLFVREPDLQYGGILPPLRLPSHPNREEPRAGMIREALVAETGPTSLVDAGFRDPVKIQSRLRVKERVTIRLTRTSPLEGEPVDPNRLPIYWGFRVTRTDLPLGKLLAMEKRDLVISTSRKGTVIGDVMDKLAPRWASSRHPLVLLGSPSEGIPEILAREKLTLDKVSDFNLNTIPDQGVETVRTEEALFSTLSELNLLGQS